MKVWITRPPCDEVYMGGLRRVLVWVDKPLFDHRAQIPDFNLHDPKTPHLVTTVYHENGWTSESGGVIARPFLKQDKDLLARVWDYIYQSCMPLGFDKPLGTPIPNADYERLLDRNYDRFCLNHWKRFLLEVDLRQDSLKIVAPMIMDDSSNMPYLSSFPPSQVLADNSQYFEQDLGRPYIDELYGHLEMSREEAWI